MSDTIDHARAMRLLPALSAQLLSDETEASLRTHVTDCAECQAALAELSELPNDPHSDPSHIPSGVLAAWPRVVREFRGLERDLVANHLSRCEECRGALAVLGYSPVMPVLEVAPPTATGVRSQRRLKWALASWATLSTAAALALALAQWPSAQPPRPEAPAPAQPSAPTRPPSAAPRPTDLRESRALSSVGDRVNIASVRRDGGMDTTRIRRAPGTWTPVFTPLLFAPAQSVNVSLMDHAGTAVRQLSVSGNQLVSNGLLMDTGELPLGDYILRLSWTKADGTPGQREYPLRIER